MGPEVLDEVCLLLEVFMETEWKLTLGGRGNDSCTQYLLERFYKWCIYIKEEMTALEKSGESVLNCRQQAQEGQD